MTLGLTVLVVDDDVGIRELVVRYLERRERCERAVAAAGIEEGEQLAHELRPDVIVLDVQMPQMSGIEGLPVLREAAPGARIIMYSADDQAREDALRAGADGWYEKSANIRDLVHEVLSVGGSDPRGAPRDGARSISRRT